MIRWYRAFLGALLVVLGTAAYGQACTVTLNPGADVTAQSLAAAPGAVICLNAGTYIPPTNGGFPNANTFAIGNGVTVRGAPGLTPAQVILQAGAAGDYAVYFVNYTAPKTANGATLMNLTIQGSNGGVQVFNFTGQTSARLNSITLKDLVITTHFPNSSGRGIIVRDSDKVNIDNVTITSGQAGIHLQDATQTLVMNSTVVATGVVGAAGFSIFGGADNVIVGNTFGSPKANPAQNSGYSIPGGNVTMYNTIGNRFDNNVIQGHADDALDIHSQNLTGAVPPAQAFQASTDNYLGKNRIIATGFAAGRDGASGIWTNCGAHRSWVYANESAGSVECGLCVWISNSNMILGNKLNDNGIAGIVVSGGLETNDLCFIPAFKTKPVSTFLQSNNVFYNRLDQVFVRSSDNTEISRNFMSPRNGFGGALRADCTSAFCQSAITFDTDGNTPNTNGARIVANTNHENIRGFQSDDGKTIGIEFAYNRMIQPHPSWFSRYVLSGTTTWDGGGFTGGNHWSRHNAAGNPSMSTPYGTNGVSNSLLGVFDSLTNTTGRIVDRFPYQSEHMGRGWNVTVYEPRANASIAQGTRRTVRWSSHGCMYMDLLLDGATTLASNVPNTGYAIVTIPDATSIASHTITVTCKDSAGTQQGFAVSPSFNVSSSTLKLMAPGRDDVFNAGSEIVVGWKKTAAIATVAIDLSTDGGATFPHALASGLTGTFARVTLPAVASTAYAVIRVRSGTTIDHTDGVFAIRGATGAGFANVPAGRRFVMGQHERLEWASPQNSRLVDLTATVGGVARVIATNLPDRGSYDWIVPETAVGTVTLTAAFKNSAGGTLGSFVNSQGSAAYPTAIAFTQITSTLGTGSTANLNATTSSGLAATYTSLTPSVCTVSGSTVTGVSAGTCTVVANQAGNASYAAAQPVTMSFTVGTVSNPARLANISTRMQVLTGNDVMIAGFIIGGSANKTVVVRARGPSLIPFGISNALQNPTLRLVRSSDNANLAINDNWVDAPNAAQISSSGFAPSENLESAIMMTLAPGAYSAVVSGVSNSTGVGIVEVFEVDALTVPLINISTRGQVLTGNDVMIAGFIIQGDGPLTVVVRARGPSLIPFGITNALQNPTLRLVRSSDNANLAINDNWVDAPNAAQISSSGFAPSENLESAIMMTLPPGAYSAVLSGVSNTTGVGIMEVFKAQ